jgi:hypothetical protein
MDSVARVVGSATIDEDQSSVELAEFRLMAELRRELSVAETGMRCLDERGV